MSLKRLYFTKDWTNAEDFPTHQTDERRVREDMQLLHGETQEYLNQVLLPRLEELGVERLAGTPYQARTAAQEDGLATRLVWQERTLTPTSLDDEAWEGMSYRQLFVDTNPLAALSFDRADGADFWSVHLGEPRLEEGVSGAAGGCLYCRSDETGAGCLIRGREVPTPSADEEHYVAFLARLEGYVSGRAGVQVDGAWFVLNEDNVAGAARYDQTARAWTTDGAFVPVSGVHVRRLSDAPAVYAGLFQGAQGELWLDEVVFLSPGRLFRDPPDRETMDALYANFTALRRGEKAAPVTLPARAQTWVQRAERERTDTQQECAAAFAGAMEARAGALGMEDMAAPTPAGLLKLCAAAGSRPRLLTLWGRRTARIALGGQAPRTVEVTAGTDYAALSGDWLAARTGSAGGQYHLLGLAAGQGGRVLALAAAGGGDDMTTAANALLAAAETALQGGSPAAVDGVTAAAVWALPWGCTAGAENLSLAPLYSQGDLTQGWAADAAAPLLCALTALDCAADPLGTAVAVRACDEAAEEGLLRVGDRLSLADAVTVLLLTGSRTAANAIARTVGAAVLRNEELGMRN